MVSATDRDLASVEIWAMSAVPPAQAVQPDLIMAHMMCLDVKGAPTAALDALVGWYDRQGANPALPTLKTLACLVALARNEARTRADSAYAVQ